MRESADDPQTLVIKHYSHFPQCPNEHTHIHISRTDIKRILIFTIITTN